MRLTAITTLLVALLLRPAIAAGDDALYQALGGKPGIAALMEDLVDRVRQDPGLAPFFKDTKKPYLAEQLTDQVCMLAGGPCQYEGANMKGAHEEFAIHKRDFNALVEALQASMRARGIAFNTQNALLARLAPMHRDIITRP